jgi:hypothetical protein
MMKRSGRIGLLALGLALPLGAAAKERGYVSLFDGKTLNGWHEEGTKGWTVREGVITGPGKGFGWLRSDREYSDFDLRLEFRNSSGGNSGVFIRASTQGRTSRTGEEIQIFDQHGGKPYGETTAAIYDMVPPPRNAAKPAGEWNTYEIRAEGTHLQVWLNGEHLQDVRTDDPALNAAIAEGHKKEPGFPLLKDRRMRGYIGLQNHGSPIEFRRVRIKDLGPSGGEKS